MKKIYLLLLILLAGFLIDYSAGLKRTSKTNRDTVKGTVKGPGEASKQQITYYGYVNKISTSGEARFWYFDIKTNDFVKPKTYYSWYWAMPVNVPNDLTLTDKWFKFVNDNINAVFKITGTKGEDDCGYWQFGPKHCMESIDIKTIEVVGKNVLMKF